MKRAILPCNGLDKPNGVVARELALQLAESENDELICPVLLGNTPARYEKTLKDTSLLVVDGCLTRCATKLANRLNLKIDERILVLEEAKNAGLKLEDSLRIGPVGMQLVERLAEQLKKAEKNESDIQNSTDFPAPAEYMEVTHDKYIFKIPSEGYYFNDNDCWVQVIGSRARVGVSDFVQQNLTDITFFAPTEVGKTVEQFDELGSVESVKSLMDVLSPVTGTVTAVNSALVDNPEFINEDPYVRGWVAELELTDFESDIELLMDCAAYAKLVKKKAEEITI
jgi:glycine cleavage system H protein